MRGVSGFDGMKSAMPREYGDAARIIDRSCNKFYLVLVDAVTPKVQQPPQKPKADEAKFEGGAPE